MKNIGFMTIGNFASKMMGFILIPLYTTKLTTTEYGIADLIFTTISLLMPIFTLEINEAVLRFTLNQKENCTYFSIGVCSTIVSILLFTIFSPILLIFDEFRTYYFLVLILYATNVLYVCFSQYAKGIDRVKEYSIGGFLNTFFVALLNVLLLVFCDLKIEGYLLSYIIGYVISSLYLMYVLKINTKIISYKFIRVEVLKEMLRYSVPLIPNAICWWINNSADKYILAIFCNTSIVGIYSISYKIPSLLSVVSSIFFSAWQISAVEKFGTEENRVFYSRIFRIFILLISTVCLVLVSGSQMLAKLLYANDFYGAWKYSIILIVAFMYNSLSSFMGTIYTSSKKTKMLLISSLMGAAVNIILNFVLIPISGAWGAAIATLVSYILTFIIRCIDTRKILKLNVNKAESLLLIGIVFIALILMSLQIKFSVLICALLCIGTISYLSVIGYRLVKSVKGKK